MPLLKKRSVPLLVLLFVWVLAVLILGTVSSIWRQQNAGTLKKCIGWTYNEQYTLAAEGAQAMQRVFFASELRDSALLVFATHNKRVRVFLADERNGDVLLYSQGFDGTHIVGSESGNIIHIVNVPNIKEERAVIIIQFMPSFHSGSLAVNQFIYNLKQKTVSPIYYGQGAASIFCLSRFTLFQIIPIGIILFLGFFCLLCVLILYIKKRIANHGLFYLGIFSLMVGINFFLESRVGFFVSVNSFATYFFSTILIAGYPIIFLKYMEKTQFLPEKQLHARLVKTISFINILLVSIVAFVLFIPFTFVRIYVCFVLVIFTLYLCLLIGYEALHTKKMLDLPDVMQMLIPLCILADFIAAFVRSNYTDIFFCTRLGMLIFLLYNTVEFTNSFFESEVLKARSSTLKMALQTDLLTGLKNGARLFENSAHAQSIMLFSIANVSNITETKGRSEAENAIRTVATVLKAHFAEDFLYYLFTGKFAVLLTHSGTQDSRSAVEAVLKDVQAYNDLQLGYSIHIVYTSGQYTSKNADDFEAVFTSLLNEVCKKNS